MDPALPSRPFLPSGATTHRELVEHQYSSVSFSSGGNVHSLSGIKQLPSDSDEAAYRLRPRSFRSYRISHPRTAREHIQLCYLPLVENESGNFFIDPELFSNKNMSIEFESLAKAFNTINHEERIRPGASEMAEAGMGAIAKRAFKENELIGFYQGHLVRRKKLPDLWKGEYKQTFESSRDGELVWPQYALWTIGEKGAEFQRTPDTYIAWTGINIYGCGEEVGIDGVNKENALSYLNHRDIPNATLQPVINSKALKHVLQDGTQHLKPDQVSSDQILLTVIATEDIPEGAEITFWYGNKVDFEHVGANILACPQQCMQLKCGQLKFLQPKDWGKDIYEKQITSPVSDSPWNEVYSDTSSEEEGDVEPGSSVAGPSTGKKPVKRAANTKIKRVGHGKIPRLEESRKTAHSLPGIVYLKRYLEELSPEDIQAAGQEGEALKKVASHIWKTLDKQQTTNSLASVLNSLGIEDSNGDWWDSASVYDYLCESSLLEAKDKFLYIPFPVLKEFSDEDPEIVKNFIKTSIEAGKYIPALCHKLNSFGITIPAGNRRRLWNVGVLKECCPDVSVDDSIRSILEKIDHMGGPSELKKYSKAVSSLLSIIRMSNDDEALCQFIVINYFAPGHEPRMIAAKLKQAKIKVPWRTDFDWGTNDIIWYLIDRDVVDLSDSQQLQALPVEAVMALNIPPQFKAKYIIAKINEGKSTVASLIHSWSRSGTVSAERSNLHGLVQLLLPHLADINFKLRIDELEAIYETELAIKRKDVKNFSAVNSKVREVSSELMFRCALEGTPGLQRYIGIMHRNGKPLGSLTTPLRKTGIPVPVEFQDENDIAEEVIWGTKNIRRGLLLGTGKEEEGGKAI